MIRLQTQEFQAVGGYIHTLCSLSLDVSKTYLIENRLGPIAEDLRCGSYLELVQRARQDGSGALQRRIINEITTRETLFFRDSAPFDLLRYKLIPELVDRRSKTSGPIPIRIWSAACSSGQELYSVAIALKETLGDLGKYKIRLLGTDISDAAVASASEGIFNDVEISRGLSDASLNRYFVRAEKGWRIRDELRAIACFRKLNLVQDFTSVGTFDIVFCRNVAIYFNEPDKISLFTRIGQRLERDGQLIIGSMESLNGLCPQFDSKRHLRGVYYELKQESLAVKASNYRQ